MYVYIITSMTAVDAVVRAREGTLTTVFYDHNGPEPERRLNRVIFMNSAPNTEVGSLNRIEYLTLRTIQFYSSGPAIADYS